MTVQEYFRLDGSDPTTRYELIGGKVYAMSGGSVAHDRLAFNVRMALTLHFRSGPCSVHGSDVQVQVNEQGDYYYPEVTVTCDVADRRPTNKVIRSPRLVVEVLSPSTAAKDQGAKLKAYQLCPTVQEVVLIDQFRERAEVYTRVEETDQWTRSIYGPGEAVYLGSLDIALSMEELYAGIDFEEFTEE